MRVESATLSTISRLPRAEQDRVLALVEERNRRALAADADLWERYDPVYYVRGEPSQVDWKNPAGDYARIGEERAGRLERLRSDPRLLSYMREYYRDNPVDFICDWGCTLDPRNADIGLPTNIPFILFPRQVEWVDYTLERWRSRRRALTEKSRDSGVTWLAVALAVTLCVFLPSGLVVGFGSRKQEYVDELGDPASILEKGRIFLRHLPEEFRGGWIERKHSVHMRLTIPETESLIVGEIGDAIGRGARTTLYFVDEAAHLEHPLIAEASLQGTTNARHDISTPHGLGNPFEQNRHSGKFEVFTFHWKSDPRKDDAWYANEIEKAHSPVIVAQEVDIDYAASVEGVLIPATWVKAALDAHEKLGIDPSGQRRLGLDVADEGTDRNAACLVEGVLVRHVEEWSGRGSDIFGTVQRAFHLCMTHDVWELRYDADGLGAGVRGDARVLQEQTSRRRMRVLPYRGSAKPTFPEKRARMSNDEDGGGNKRGLRNKDVFNNLKAQSWWALRVAFQTTYRAVVEGMACDPDEVVSISSEIPSNVRSQLESELSQATYSTNGAGKILVNKTPPGTRSPNLADALVVARARLGSGALVLPQTTLHRVAGGAQGILAPRDRFGGARATMVTRDRFARVR